MAYKFAEYEMLRLKNLEGKPQAAVRGWDATGTIYDLRLPSGQTVQAREDDLETTGQYETPFRFYEVVEIYPSHSEDDQALVALTGKRGVVTGVSPNTQSGYWGFSVETQSGDCWYFEENELKSTGIFLSKEQLNGPSDDAVTIRLRFNPNTGEETVISGDASLLNRGPTALRIDLEALSA